MGILQCYSHYTSNYFQKASSVHISTCNHLLVFFSIFCSWNVSKLSKNIFHLIIINEFDIHRRITDKSVTYVSLLQSIITSRCKRFSFTYWIEKNEWILNWKNWSKYFFLKKELTFPVIACASLPFFASQNSYELVKFL